MSMTPQEYTANLQGFSVVDCTVRSRDIFYFVARQQGTPAGSAISEHRVNKRVVAYMRDEPEEARWSHAELEGMTRLVASSSITPQSQFVGVDSDRAVYVLGSGQSCLEKAIPSGPDGPMRGAPWRARAIDGQVYVVGGRRGLCKRLDSGMWQSLCPAVDIRPKSRREEFQLTKDWGFCDVDGFSESEIYAVGGKGDVWRVREGSCQKLELDTSLFLGSVCCGDDGRVYIGAQSGIVIVGRGDQWEVLDVPDDLNMPYHDLVWYDGTVYGGNDYGLWRLHGHKMVRVELPDAMTVCSGHLCVQDGVLLMAGALGAAFLESGRWSMLFNAFEAPHG